MSMEANASDRCNLNAFSWQTLSSRGRFLLAQRGGRLVTEGSVHPVYRILLMGVPIRLPNLPFVCLLFRY
jgi:hypothetical protein